MSATAVVIMLMVMVLATAFAVVTAATAAAFACEHLQRGGDFLLRGFADIHDFAHEDERLAGQGMVQVENNVCVADFGNKTIVTAS